MTGGKYLIVNGDELGLTEQVNRGIVEAHLQGVLTSATLIPNMWAFEDAVALALANPSLAVGVHLNLTDGAPVLSGRHVPTLVDADGRFLGRRRLIRRLLMRSVRSEEVRDELRAQIEKAIAAGVVPSHLDSHQNSFMFPSVFRIVMGLGREYGVPVRLPQEQLIFSSFDAFVRHLPSPRLWKKAIMWCVSVTARPWLRRRGVPTIEHMVSTVGCFDGTDVNSITLRTYELILNHLRPGVSELMVHPGYADERLAQFVWGGWPEAKRRERELAVLCDPRLREMLERRGIRLVTYRELAGLISGQRDHGKTG